MPPSPAEHALLVRLLYRCVKAKKGAAEGDVQARRSRASPLSPSCLHSSIYPNKTRTTTLSNNNTGASSVSARASTPTRPPNSPCTSTRPRRRPPLGCVRFFVRAELCVYLHPGAGGLVCVCIPIDRHYYTLVSAWAISRPRPPSHTLESPFIHSLIHPFIIHPSIPVVLPRGRRRLPRQQALPHTRASSTRRSVHSMILSASASSGSALLCSASIQFN